MSFEDKIVLALSVGIFLLLALAASGALDRISTGKWPRRSQKVPDSKEGKLLYVGMSDVWLSEDTRCVSCDTLISEAGGYFFFDDRWLCCTKCMNVPTNVIASNIFQVHKNYSLHAYFCDC